MHIKFWSENLKNGDYTQDIHTYQIMDLMVIGCMGVCICNLFNDSHCVASNKIMINKELERILKGEVLA